MKIVYCILLTFIIYYLFKQYYHPNAINVDKDLLNNIFEIGYYKGYSTYSPTDIYKNGLYSKDKLEIIKNYSGIRTIVTLDAYDKLTNKKVYTGKRISDFVYKENHGNNLFRISKSYINNKIVSSSHGFAIAKSNNSIEFKLTGSWHNSSHDFHKINLKIKRENNKILAEFVNKKNLINHSVFKHEYTQM